MLFPTTTFALFFALVLPLSWLTMPDGRRWRPFIVLASFVFYSWWDWRFVLLLGGSIVLNQVFAVRIHRARRPSLRKRLLIVALAANVGLLAYFKYYDFFVSSSQNLLSLVGLDMPLEIRSVVLPVGISFYVHGDQLRRRRLPRRVRARVAGRFAAYLSFFPHLVAGPIVRPGS